MKSNVLHTIKRLNRRLESAGSPSANSSQLPTKPHRLSKSNVFTLLAVSLLLITMGLQMSLAARNDSATTDEQIHILSGYTTLTQHHILFDPEHPFLAKVLSAIPLLFVHPNMPYKAAHLTADQAKVTYNTYREANVWGFEFIFTQGNNPYQLLNLARSVIIILTLLLGLLIFLWTRQNLGTPAALAALTFFTFDPTFITHGHLANDDTVAALFFVASLASFQWFLTKQNKKSLIITGLILGLGFITKYSLLALGPIFVLIAIIWSLLGRTQKNRSTQAAQSSGQGGDVAKWQAFLLHPLALSHARTCALSLLAIFLIAWAVIWLSYGSLALINPAQNPLFVDYRTVYAAAIPGTHIPSPNSLTGRALNDIGHLFPVMWLKGFALISPTAAGHSREGFLLGQCFRGSRWDYFPTLILFKTPLPVLILLTTSLIMLGLFIIQKSKHSKQASRQAPIQSGRVDEPTNTLSPAHNLVEAPEYSRRAISLVGLRFTLLFLALPTLIYLFIASFSDIDIGIRHILPIYTLILILAAWPLSLIRWSTLFANLKTKLLFRQFNQTQTKSITNGTNRPQKYPSFLPSCLLGFISLLFLWLIVGTLRTYPNYLPYYNELAQEPRNIPYISNDSNIDWGQATKELDDYIQAHHITHFAFDNFIGYGEAHYRHMPFDIAQPDNHNYKGYLAISRSTIIDHLCSQNNNWGWVVDHYQPVAIIGNAINLYYIP